MSALSDPAAPRIVGHQWALDAISRQIQASSRAHAYLVTGPAHVGKYTTALEMARLFLCDSTPACGTCRHCRLAVRAAHPDLRTLEIPSDRKTIPIKDVHDFVQGIALKPLESAVKVYILHGADDLSEEGANALLKTIEEPPAAVTIILTASSPSTLLPTIVSRCQAINLHRVAPLEILELLVSAYGVDQERAEAIAQACQGCPGWAVLAAGEKTDLIEERQERARDLIKLLRGDRLARIRYADDLADEWRDHADDVREVLETWNEVWRDILLAQQGLSERASGIAGRGEIDAAVKGLNAEQVQTSLQRTLDVADALARNAHPRLALETYLLLLPHLSNNVRP